MKAVPAAKIRAFYNAGNHEGALALLMTHASELGLDAGQLYRMPTTEACLKGLRALRARRR